MDLALQMDRFSGLERCSPHHCETQGCSVAHRNHLSLDRRRIWTGTEVL